jgi:spore germination cell wall hydrolase CwlJ-like protein
MVFDQKKYNREYMKVYNQKHRAKINAYMLKYYQTHKEAYKRYGQTPKSKAYDKKYRDEHKAYYAKYSAQW